MADSQITKRVLADSIKALMAKTPLSKISIGDIASQCGVNRQTFYYHFKDKYDLVNWIFYTETIQYIGLLTDKDTWHQGLELLCLYMQENKKFYINAMSITGQNSFPEYLTGFIHDLVSFIFEKPKNDGKLTKFQHSVIVDYYTFATVGIISKWVNSGMKTPPGEFISCIKEFTYPSFAQK